MNTIIVHLKRKSGTGFVYVIGPDSLKTFHGSILRCLYAMRAEAEETGYPIEVKNHFDR